MIGEIETWIGAAGLVLAQGYDKPNTRMRSSREIGENYGWLDQPQKVTPQPAHIGEK